METRKSSPLTRTLPKLSSMDFFTEKASSDTENSGTLLRSSACLLMAVHLNLKVEEFLVISWYYRQMIRSFSPYIYKDEAEAVEELLNSFEWPRDKALQVEQEAVELVNLTRGMKARPGQLESFLQEFALNTDEGLAMMCLAEALLRIPDTRTANALMKDRVSAANWLQSQGKSSDWVTKAAGVGMAVTKKTLDGSLSRLGEPVIREAMIKAMQMMGKQFVLGVDIKAAMINAKPWEKAGYRMSYDMLGEAARDQATADIYFDSYKDAIEQTAIGNERNEQNSGVSVKLSALHPRFEYSQKDRCVPEIVERLGMLAVTAAKHDVPLTIDAEEANRLDLTIEIFERVLAEYVPNGWEGYGIAVQAYQKRALPLVKYLADHVNERQKRIQVRLVKGAYWDTEIKRAQVGGFPEYPVFTRKNNTDVSYMACAYKLLKNADVIYPMFATHNAYTISAVRQIATECNITNYEFQRLHGMGESLYGAFMQECEDVKASIYAPVGIHKDLLPYLVRRLLENGANSSFVNKLMDESVPANEFTRDPVDPVRKYESKRHPQIPLPSDLFGEVRENSRGLDLDDPLSSAEVVEHIESYRSEHKAFSLVGGNRYEKIDGQFIEWAFDNAKHAFNDWNYKSAQQRALALESFADILENHRTELMSILVHEAGKTIPDALDEVREAVDFCRYYAAQGRDIFDSEGTLMPGYTGETNRLIMQGRGTFVCISPWNFPLAIFVGQVVAALMAGNAVIAKPASQTPYIAMRAVELMHRAGIPHSAIQLLLGNGAFGSKILEHKDVAGVAFTGSTDTAKRIQQTLVVHNDAVVPFIAETGGQNAMIVDSSSLLEQVVDDVVHSAFGSAGQRCSALRVLYVQNDIATPFMNLLEGAMKELKVTSPHKLSADIGYVIDGPAKQGLDKYIDYIEAHGRKVGQADISRKSPDNSRLFAPVAYEISNIHVLDGEVFGPVLHILRFHIDQLRFVINQINRSGYGLTFGMHTRIQSRHEKVADAIRAGNIYVNRSTTGAIVGVQPFGGMGLSGTGPKAGGPHYLHGFATEKVITIDTTASGGNASLLSIED